jgi:hypothetical protein
LASEGSKLKSKAVTAEAKSEKQLTLHTPIETVSNKKQSLPTHAPSTPAPPHQQAANKNKPGNLFSSLMLRSKDPLVMVERRVIEADASTL